MELREYLSKFYTEKPLNSVSLDTLNKKLDILPPNYCKTCSVRLKFNSSTGKSSTYCPKCANKKRGTTLKNTVIKKYGVSNISQIEEIQQKKRSNCIEKYGVTNTSKLKEVIEKAKQTSIEKYGLHHTKTESVKRKIKQTNNLRYGVDSFLKTEKARDARKMANYKKIEEKSDLVRYEGGYSYNCPICGYNNKYKNDKSITHILQRARQGTILCVKCLPKDSVGINSRSSVEIRLEEDIKLLGIRTVHHKEIDIYLPDYNVGIEVNGIYWHSDKWKHKNYHKDKIQKYNDLDLLFFTDFQLEKDREKILNYIKGKIGLLSSIGASKCKLEEITNTEAKLFCEKYHIHGFARGSMYYGLKLKGELVSVCIIGKNRFKNDNSIEIIRLANKTKIIGGFARFLKRIKNDFKGKNITTFIDAYLGNKDNNIFTRNGFSYIGHTSPNYSWYIDRGQTKLSRHQTMKHKLLKQGFIGDTEDSIMKNRGGIKVYDGGNYKFELKD